MDFKVIAIGGSYYYKHVILWPEPTLSEYCANIFGTTETALNSRAWISVTSVCQL